MFQGFSNETFEFFMAIRFNNNRDFFHDNHDWYVNAVRQPGLDLAQALSPAVEALDENLERRPNRVLSRINRDIRFSNDKSPYRDHIWLAFHLLGDSEKNMPCAYFDLGLDGGAYGFGMYHANKPLMNALRRELSANPDPFLEAWLPICQEFTLYGNAIKRMAVPDDLPDSLKPWYNLRGFYLEKEIQDFDLLKSAHLADEISGGMARFAPMFRYFQRLTPVESD